MYTFRVEYGNGEVVQIKARSFLYLNHKGYCFYRAIDDPNGGSHADAQLDAEDIISVIPQDMLVTSFSDSTVLPEILESGEATTDYAKETLFSESDRTRFSQEERRLIQAALQKAAEDIHNRFKTTREQDREVVQKLEYLSRKIQDLDKFDWKRLLVTTLVGISVDIGFGTLIPSALLDLFKELLAHVSHKLIR